MTTSASLDNARQAAEAQDFSTAITMLDALLAEKPDDVGVIKAYAEIAYCAGDFVRAHTLLGNPALANTDALAFIMRNINNIRVFKRVLARHKDGYALDLAALTNNALRGNLFIPDVLNKQLYTFKQNAAHFIYNAMAIRNYCRAINWDAPEFVMAYLDWVLADLRDIVAAPGWFTGRWVNIGCGYSLLDTILALQLTEQQCDIHLFVAQAEHLEHSHRLLVANGISASSVHTYLPEDVAVCQPEADYSLLSLRACEYLFEGTPYDKLIFPVAGASANVLMDFGKDHIGRLATYKDRFTSFREIAKTKVNHRRFQFVSGPAQ